MKAHFIRLFDYDKWANDLILDSIIKANNPQKPVQLMAHLLAAEQVWLNRCNGLSAIGLVLWPDWAAGTFAGLIERTHNDWITFLDTCEDEDFGQLVNYKNLKGESFENKLSDILTHVINHGTHHRAQAGQHLVAAGMDKLPATDYIFYLR